MPNHPAPVERISEVTAGKVKAVPVQATDRLIDQAIRETTRRNLRVVMAGLVAMYGLLAFSHALLIPAPAKRPLVTVAVATALMMLGTYLYTRRQPIPLRYAYAAAFGVAAVVLLNSLLHLLMVPDPIHTTNLMALVVGTALFVLSARWFVAMVGLVWVGWIGIALQAPPAETWVHFGFALMMSSLLAALTHLGVVRTLRSLEQRNLERDAEVAVRKRAEAALREQAAALEAANNALEAANAELERSNTELERSNKELDDFAYVASHDLKEPLRGIHNFSRFLLEDYGPKLDDEGRSKLHTLGRLSQRMEAIINALLAYARLGRTEMDITTVDLNLVIEEVLDLLDFALKEEHVTVRLPRHLPTLACDKVRVEQVYLNLIDNAIKYNMGEDKWVEVGYEEPNGAQPVHVFYVRDNGIGIREKHQDIIFHMFKRLNRRGKYGEGYGVGLTMAHKNILRHGGRIWLISTPGEGTTFFFTLQPDPAASSP